MTRDQLLEIFPDQSPVDLLCGLWDVMQAWDDAEDGDEADHTSAYRQAMIDLPNHPLYQRCSIPFLVAQCYYDWKTANIFEREGRELHKAYMLRAGWYRIIISVIHLLYGNKEAERLAPTIWACYGEEFENYQREMEQCQIQSPAQ